MSGTEPKRSGRSRLQGSLALTLSALLSAATVCVEAPGAGASVEERPAYAVGTFTQTLIDTSRATPRNGSVPARPSRTLETTLFYPAEGPPGGQPTVGQTPDRRGAPYPLIVFAHGFGSSVTDYRALLARWTQAGYVVAAPLFPLTQATAAGGPDLADFVNQPRDLSFVITQVLQESASPGGLLSGLVDAHRIGAAGHSLGGVTTLGLVANTCCKDSRVRAAVVMSGDPIAFPTGKPDYSSTPPLLLVHGDADEAVPYASSIDAFNAAHPPKGLLTVLGGGHGAPVDPAGRAFSSVVRVTNDFFDRYLKRERVPDSQLFSDTQRGVTTLVFASKRGESVRLSVPHAATRHREADVSPARNLSDGEAVVVSWKGYTPGVSINILECSKNPPTAAADCDLQTARLLQPDPKGSGSLLFRVHTGSVGSGTCDAAHPGCVVVVNEGGSLARSASVIRGISFDQ